MCVFVPPRTTGSRCSTRSWWEPRCCRSAWWEPTRGSSASTSTAPIPSSKPPERATYPRNWAHSRPPRATKANWDSTRMHCETSFSPNPHHHLLLPCSPKYTEGDVTLFALNLYNVTQHFQLPNYLSSKHVDQYLLLPHGKETILSR